MSRTDLSPSPAPDPSPDGPLECLPHPASPPRPDDVPESARRSKSDSIEEAEQLGDEIAILAAHIHAATQRFMELIARFDELRGWEPGGFRSCAHWLAFRTGLDLGTAREKVRTARALERLPRVSASMARGALSFSQVRALTRVATPENEEDLLELAEGTTTAQLERLVRSWKRLSRKDEVELERERHESRFFSVFPDEEGMYLVRGRLDPEVGAVLMRAIDAAGDALYRRGAVRRLAAGGAPDGGCRRLGGSARGHAAGGRSDPVDISLDPTGTEAKRRRADALGLLAERALAAGFGGGAPDQTSSTDQPSRDEAHRECAPREQPRPEQDDHDRVGGGERCGHPVPCNGAVHSGGSVPPVSGTRAERYQVVLHVELDTLRADGAPARSDLEDGTRVSPETSRRLGCDAALIRVTHAPNGSILDLGRRTRTIPPALRRALEIRDGGCRFPGCGLRFTDAHHVRHWADGGETSLSNTLLVCRTHHRLLHEGGWRVEFWGTQGAPAFLSPRGETFVGFRRPVAELPPRPVDRLAEDNRTRGAAPNPFTAGARWKCEADIPDPVLFRALEALE